MSMDKPRTFADVVFYCFENKEFVAQWERLNGMTLAFRPPRNGLEAMIDKACGVPALNPDAAFKFIRDVRNLVWNRLPPECFEWQPCEGDDCPHCKVEP